MYQTGEAPSCMGYSRTGETRNPSLEGDGHLGHEEVDDVQVEGDGCHHVLVVGVALQQLVGVIDDEAREHHGGQDAVDGHGYPSQREADLDDDVHQQHDEAGEQEGEREGEVVAPLDAPEGEEGEPQDSSSCEDGSLQDHCAEGGGGGDGDAETAAESEYGEQDEVPGVLLPVLEHGEHDCTNKTAIGGPFQNGGGGAGGEEARDRADEARGGRDGRGERELEGENGVHLPHEGPAQARILLLRHFLRRGCLLLRRRRRCSPGARGHGRLEVARRRARLHCALSPVAGR
uniref:Uncharacterized protein n=1 Tax=Zea mays TaxID=4577 RepID=C0P641_MAIZE|nr:unknown [Zea mays]